MPVFFDAGLIILIPLAFSLAKRTKRSSTLKTWTIMETLVGGTGFVVALIISFFA